MKISLFTIAFLFSVQLNAQWSGAIMDTLTFNSERDEVNHQSFSIDREAAVMAANNKLIAWQQSSRCIPLNLSGLKDGSLLLTYLSKVLAQSKLPLDVEAPRKYLALCGQR